MLRTYTAFGTYVLYIPSLATPTNQTFKVMRIEFNNAGNADRWLMIFSGTAIPVNNSVPIVAASFMQATFSGVAEALLPDGLTVPAPGVVIVISSNEFSLTQDVGANCDITAYVEEWEMLPVGASTVGDYTSYVAAQQVWTEASGPKRLIKLEMSNKAAVSLYANIHAVDVPANTDKVLASVLIPPKVGGVNGFVVANFGNVQGFSPFQQNADKTRHQGCNILFSTTTAPGQAYNPASIIIKATYV